MNERYEEELELELHDETVPQFPLSPIELETKLTNISLALAQNNQLEIIHHLYQLQIYFKETFAIEIARDLKTDFNVKDAATLIRKTYPEFNLPLLDDEHDYNAAVLEESLLGRYQIISLSDDFFKITQYRILNNALTLYMYLTKTEFGELQIEKVDLEKIEKFATNFDLDNEMINIFFANYEHKDIDVMVTKLYGREYSNRFYAHPSYKAHLEYSAYNNYKKEQHIHYIKNATAMYNERVKQLQDENPVNDVPQTYQDYLILGLFERLANQYHAQEGSLKQRQEANYSMMKPSLTLKKIRDEQLDNCKNIAAREFVDAVKYNIENTNWEVHKWGSVSVECAGEKKRLPTDLAKIYKLCLKADESGEFRDRFNEIVLIGKKLAQQFSFFKKNENIIELYNSLEESYKNRTKHGFPP